MRSGSEPFLAGFDAGAPLKSRVTYTDVNTDAPAKISTWCNSIY